MPDISKLPDLAELFGTTIDELLGRHSPLIEKAAEDKLDELPTLTVDELAEAAPLLPPRQMDELTDRLLEFPILPDMDELLRYLPTEKVDALLRQRLEAGASIRVYALFASTGAVDNAAHVLEQQGRPILEIAPFMSKDCVDAIARRRAAEGRSFTELLPFLYKDSVNDLACQLDAKGSSIAPLFPFMDEGTLDGIALTRLQQGRSITELLPFVGERLLIRLAEAASSNN